MSDSNKGIDGRNVALVLMTLGGVGGYLWLDHKLRIEKQVNQDLTAMLMTLASLEGSAALAKLAGIAVPKLSATTIDALPKELAQQLRALPAPADAGPTARPRRNATSLARLPRIELAPRTYDDVFANRGRGLPVAFLRALALHESDMRPRLADGPAWGLMQIIEVVREDYNRRERSNFSRQDLLDPAVSVTIAASALALIAKSYATNHPLSTNLQTNWRNPQFVALLALGWNAGWSERGGVGRVASFLEQRSADVTINAVFDAAAASGASRHLCNPAKLAFAKQVTRQYFAELADEERVIEIEDPPRRPASDRPAVVVEAPSSPSPEPHADTDERIIIIDAPAVPSDATGPITSPTQLEHEAAPAGVVMVPMEHPDAAGPVAAPPPAMAPPPIGAPPVAAGPSGGSGPIDPYAEPYGYPEDPYAFNYAPAAPGPVPHA
jgi:hypothetical protein